MENLALLANFEAKLGKEQQVADFLTSALSLAEAEPGIIRWYALQIGSSTFGIFDTFADDAGRDAHLTGEIAKELMASADELLVSTPVINKVKILAFK
jgi:quinol monooxygenase YgiN